MSKNAPDIVKNMFELTACLNHQKLLAYAENTLPSSEKHDAEKHLIDCPFCAEAFEGLMNRDNKNDTTEIIENLNTNVRKKLELKSTYSTWKRYAYSVAAVLIICAGYIHFNQLNQSESDVIFNTYFEAYPNTIPILRGDANSGDLQNAMIEYEKKNYSSALFFLQKILREYPDHPQANFYTGISYLCIENPTKAILLLERLQKLDTNMFVPATYWYLGLAYIKNENFKQAEIQFNLLIQTDNKFKKSSIEIIKILRQIENYENHN